MEEKKTEDKNRGNTRRIWELVDRLNEAARAYYAEDREIMSNFEYDRLYDELLELEKKTGIVLSDSPTVHVGYEVSDALPKERHPVPMLSLNKTKDVGELVNWLGDHEGLLSWKMDGLTVVLTYREGKLEKAVTRGNGEVGEVITANARTFRNIPLQIPCAGELVIRGEAVISYADFERINAEVPETAAKYKNPRNLCSGAVRQLNSEITAKRHVYFIAFSLMDPADQELNDRLSTFESRFLFLKSLGFDVVEFEKVTADTLPDMVKKFAARLPENAFPSDGLVLDLNDIPYGRSLGTTAKFPRDAIAFKWQDEEAETVLREIIWSPSRTGLINPVAVFDPVELEGTEVKRASLHNITYVKDMRLGIGDRIRVYKANMIIPQIAENLTKSGNAEIAENCPACGGKTEIFSENGTETLHCMNPDCPAKHVKRFTLFASRNAMNIDGISEQTMERFIDAGFLHHLADLYHLDRYRWEIVDMDGFGEKSYENMHSSIERSREADPAAFLYGLGIPDIGVSNARVLMGHFGYDLQQLMQASVPEMCEAEGIGEKIAEGVRQYFQKPENREEVSLLLQEVRLIHRDSGRKMDLAGKTFVITGTLETYPDRAALKKEIQDRGGKVTGTVSRKTDYLINNNPDSTSSKNKTARALNIPVITEEEYKKL